MKFILLIHKLDGTTHVFEEFDTYEDATEYMENTSKYFDEGTQFSIITEEELRQNPPLWEEYKLCVFD